MTTERRGGFSVRSETSGVDSSFASTTASPSVLEGVASSLPLSCNPKNIQAEDDTDWPVPRTRDKNHGAQFTLTRQTNDIVPSSRWMTLQTSAIFQKHKPLEVPQDSSCLDVLSVNKRLPEGNSVDLPPSVVPGYPGSRDGAGSVSIQPEAAVQSDLKESGDGAPEQHRAPKFTPEQANKILLHYGLDKDDLSHLLSYPEEQMHVENLPLILKQISMEKMQKAQVPSENCSDLQGFTEIFRKDETGVKMHQDEGLLTVSPRMGAGSESIPDDGGTSSMDRLNKGLHCEEQVKNGGSPSLPDQRSSLNSLRTSAIPTGDLQAQGKHISKSNTSFQKNIRQLSSEVSKSVVPKEPASDSTSTSASELQGNGQSNARLSKISKHLPKQSQEKVQRKPMFTQPNGDKLWSSVTSVPPCYDDLQTANVPPAVPYQSQLGCMDFWERYSSTNLQEMFYRGVPAPSMMQEYAATPPRSFPHTCCLCNTPTAHMEDWIYHQNSNRHLENCKLLRQQYPAWDGKVPLLQSYPDRHLAPKPPQTSQNLRPKSRREIPQSRDRSSSRSPSKSPLLDEDLGVRRSQHLSRSRSGSPLYNCPSTSSHQPRVKGQSSSRSGQKKQRSFSKRQRSSGKRKTSRTVEKLTKKLLETPDVQSLLELPSLEEMLKTLIPLLLTEFRKIKSSCSSYEAKKQKSGNRNPDPEPLSSTKTKDDDLQSSPASSWEQKPTCHQKSSDSAVLTSESTEPHKQKGTNKGKRVPKVLPLGTKTPKCSSARVQEPPEPDDEAEVSEVKTDDQTEPMDDEGLEQNDSLVPEEHDIHPTTSEAPDLPEGNSMEKQTAAGITMRNASPQQQVGFQPSTSAASLTAGERISELLHQTKIRCLSEKTIKSSKFSRLRSRLLLITGLPEYADGRYTEQDVVHLLCPLGFEPSNKCLYVIPQTCMAFAVMPCADVIRNIIAFSQKNDLMLKGSRLGLHVVISRIATTPFGFYKSIMKKVHVKVKDDGSKTVFIQNISASEARELRETLTNIASLKNFLPLLNKVWVEFTSVGAADRLGVWFSLLSHRPVYSIYRIKIPQSSSTPSPSELAAEAFPDDKLPGPVIPNGTRDVPRGSTPPFWVTMTTSPFIFPTYWPCFVIPDYLTVDGMQDVESAPSPRFTSSTVMLTGLPQGNLTQRDVAQLVWPFLPQQTRRSLFYNVTVLPLQRRAFVHFNDRDSCCRFLKSHISKRVSVRGCVLSAHLVLEDMEPAFNEEIMYRTLMKWSNSRVPDLESLEERLLCVEISESSVGLVMTVMEAVASTAPFQGFLSLTNRICIELTEPRDVTRVVEKISANISSMKHIWSKVKSVSSLKSFKQRLQNSWSDRIDTELNCSSRTAEPNGVLQEEEEAEGEEMKRPDDDSRAVLKTPLTHSSDPPAAVPFQMVGEQVELFLHQDKISCLKMEAVLSSRLVSLGYNVLLITNLPEQQDGSYTEDDVANILHPFRFRYQDDNIYVVPQARMAFALLQSAVDLQNLMNTSMRKNFFLSGFRLCLHVVKGIIRTPDLRVDAGRTVYIKNISQSEARRLMKALSKIGSVRNVLPLLNKMFVEFESAGDADRLGVWYSLLRWRFDHKVYRMKIPQSLNTAEPPRWTPEVLPDGEDSAAAAARRPVPHGSTAPFWVTMRTSPHMFPTASPWFFIPDHKTVREAGDVEEVSGRASVFSTVMLTGFPEGNYTQEDVAKLVWRYFPRRTLGTLLYNVMVLTLQRRAFVFFSSWESCLSFVQSHIRETVSVGGFNLHVHFVLQDMRPGSSEEVMYRSLMKWSNSRVPDRASLERCLLCVDVSEASVSVVMMVTKVVASVAPFVGFLPLANRICIEMAEPDGVTRVMERIHSMDLSANQMWRNVRRVETLWTFKQRLQDCGETTLNIEVDCNKTKASLSSSSEPTGSISASIPSHYVKTRDEKKVSQTGCREPAGQSTVCAETTSKWEANDVLAQEQNENDKENEYYQKKSFYSIKERSDDKSKDVRSSAVCSEMLEGQDDGAGPERSQTSLKEDYHFSDISEDEVCVEEHSGRKVDVPVQKQDMVFESQRFIAGDETFLMESEDSSSKPSEQDLSQAFNCSDNSTGKTQRSEDDTSRTGEDSDERDVGPSRKSCTDDSFNSKDQTLEGQDDVVCRKLESVEGTKKSECQKVEASSSFRSKENTKNAEEMNVFQVKGPTEDQITSTESDASIDQDETRRQSTRDPHKENYQPNNPTTSYTREMSYETTRKGLETHRNSSMENIDGRYFTASIKDDLFRKLNEERPCSLDSKEKSFRTTPVVPINDKVLEKETVDSLRDDPVQEVATAKKEAEESRDEVMVKNKSLCPEEVYQEESIQKTKNDNELQGNSRKETHKLPVKRKIFPKVEEPKKKVSRFCEKESRDRREKGLVGTIQKIPEELCGEEAGTADEARNDGIVDLQKIEEKDNHEEMLKINAEDEDDEDEKMEGELQKRPSLLAKRHYNNLQRHYWKLQRRRLEPPPD
ncbi:hypothetical protein OJAV_G00183800 [Oryzias javanicus]|uniref:Matrin-type domain-containing protein n=1 Tax=Oryzias javanicus TaxID=123683 RepID=A0A3S2PGX5_ORYJA|nr:hypothetical protein OJAV_G00183800 [Oryzias javanicus]